MVYSYKGYNSDALTIECDGNVEVGKLVFMTAGGMAREAHPGEKFMGVCINSKPGCVVVQLSGYIEMNFSGGRILTGFSDFTTGENGYICNFSSDSGDDRRNCSRECLVLKVDDVNGKIGFIL